MEMITRCERYFTPIGRIILGAFFLLSGIPKLMDLSGTAGYIESVNLPAGMLLALIAVLIEVGAGAALMVNYKAKWSALVLAAFTFIVSWPFHGPSLWGDQMQQIMFMKNMAILGGLLFIAAHIDSPCCNSNTYTHADDDKSPAPTL